MGRRFTASELLGDVDLVWLLSIEWAGRTYRWSSRPCAPLDADSQAVPHDGGLPAVEFSESFSLLSLSPDTRSVSLELDFPVDVAALIQAGHDLAAGTGELALWRDGDAYEDRMVLLSGRVREPEYGADGEPVALTMEQEPWDDRALVPASTARVTPDTWPTAASAAKGIYYPLVFGEPGLFRDSDGTEETTSGSPGLVVEWDGVNSVALTVLIAGHEVAASSVKVYTADGQSSVTLSVSHTTDGLGRKVAIVDLSGESATFADDSEYWIGWNDGGGILSDDRSEAITGAGDLLLYFLRQASVEADYGRFRALRDQLNAYKIGGYIDEATSPAEWLADNLLPLLPVSLVWGTDGVYPVLWDLDAGPLDAVGEVVAGPGIVRTGPVKYIRAARDLLNELRLSFALRARTGEFRRVLTCTPEPDPDSADDFASHYSVISASRYGVQGESIETDVVYDTSTAGLILQWMVRAKALPIRTVTYECGVDHGWLEPGDVILLTDEELSFSEQVALVESLTWTSEVSVELTILVAEDPARDR